jgi:hypothetical protein
MGTALWASGRHEEAIAAFREAILGQRSPRGGYRRVPRGYSTQQG